ncbi:hypothetical protein BC941DRAFT_191300 [Chlamydoabsidia padenii]|nr:hypothetical protein BC941DRAFT_191300 [Chlamydoabsidia padenii]
MNNANVPPVFPTTLSGFVNTDEVNEDIVAIMNEGDTDLLILYNMASMQEYNDGRQKEVEQHYRHLHEKVIHVENGLQTLMNLEVTRNLHFSQTMAANNDVGIAVSLERIAQALLNVALLHQRSVDLLRLVANNLGLELLFHDERWGTATMDPMIDTLPGTIMNQQQVIQQLDFR